MFDHVTQLNINVTTSPSTYLVNLAYFSAHVFHAW